MVPLLVRLLGTARVRVDLLLELLKVRRQVQTLSVSHLPIF